jgi:hypothetical protein
MMKRYCFAAVIMIAVVSFMFSCKNVLSPLIGSIQDRFPPDGASLLDTTPGFTWTEVAGAVTYEFQHGTVEDDLHESDIIELTESTYTPGSPLADNTTYYWRVRGINSEGSATAWSLIYSFRIGFSNMTPEGGELVPDTTPAFNWDDVIGAESYELKYAASLADLETAAAETLEESTFTPGTYLTNLVTTYYWKVRAADNEGIFGAWSEVESFGVWWGEISGHSPEDEAYVDDTTPSMEWDPVPGAAHYEVKAAETLDELENINSITVTSPFFTYPDTLEHGDTLFWGVQAVDVDGQYGPEHPTKSMTIFIP